MNHHHQSNQNHSQQPNHPNYHQHHPTPISLTPQQQQVLLQSQAQLIQQQQQLIQQQQQQHQRIQANQHHNHKSSSSSSSSSSSQTRINSQHPNHQANILQHHQQQQQPLLLPKHHSIQQPSPNQHHPSINPIKRPSPSYNEVLGPNTALSRAKRFRPTDRTLPVFEPADPNAPRYSLDGLIPERQNIIYRMSKNYERLQKIEQEFDWLISRKRFEIEDLLRRTNGVQRRLRIKVWNTVSNQSWQQSSSRSTSTTSNVKSNRTKTCDQTTDHDQKPQEEDPEPENQGDDDDDDDDDDENQPEADPNESSGVPSSGTPGLTGINFNSGEGIPKWTLHLEAHLIPPQCPCAPSSEPDQDSVGNEPSPPEIKIVETPRPFSTLLNAVLIKINRSEELYPEPNFVEWHRPTSTTTTTSSTISNSHQPFSTITMSRSGSENCWVDIALHLNHYPQRFKISPILGSFLDLNEASLDELFESIWCYIKKNKLIDNGLDKRLIRKDSNLGCLFPPSVDRIQFHQLAEQVRKYLGVPEPALIRYEIKVDKENQNRAEYFDIQFSIEDPAKLHLINIKNQLEDVHLPAPSQNQAHKDPVSITKEILALDEQIMDSIAKIREVKIRRDFYKRFTNDPIKFIEEWIGSQSRDLEILFGLDKGSEGTSVNSMLYHPRMNSKNRGLFDEAQTHPDGLLDFDHLKRYSKFYDQPWVEDAVKIYQSRDFNQQVFQQSNLKPPTSNLNPHHNNTIPMVHMNPNNHLVGLSSSNPNNPTAASSVGVSSMVGNLNHGNGHINPHHAHPPHQMLTSTNNPTGKGSIASHSNPGAMPNSISSIPNSHANGLSTATHMAPTGHNHPPNSNGPNHPNLRGSR